VGQCPWGRTVNALEAVLINARKLIETPERWTKGAFWRDSDGNSNGRHEGAASMCAWGALRAADETRGDLAYVAEALIMGGRFDDERIEDWNDEPSTTHADVMAAFDLAIQKARDAQ
jgi:hypothetical protein